LTAKVAAPIPDLLSKQVLHSPLSVLSEQYHDAVVTFYIIFQLAVLQELPLVVSEIFVSAVLSLSLILPLEDRLMGGHDLHFVVPFPRVEVGEALLPRDTFRVPDVSVSVVRRPF
jgi:hypothetical protein